jgi:hypothetical protein
MSSKPSQATKLAQKTPKKPSATPAASVTPAAPAPSAAPPVNPTPTSAVAQAPGSLSAKTGIALSLLPAPPPSASIPVPPSGADAPGGQNYRAVVPRKIELAALPGAVTDLQRCTSFAQIFGATGLPYAQVLQAFEVASAWSTMRNETAAWDTYCQTQEGICWGVLRTIMDSLKPAFEVATTGNPSLATTLPSFATLFGAKKAIALKSASTRRLNKAAVARGEAPTHGGVGKQRLRAAEKAALAAAKASSGAALAPSAAVPTTSPAVAPVQAAGAAPAAPAAPVAATSGGAHS